MTTQGELSASKNPQLAALGAQLKTAINSWATAKGNGAGKDDVLLQAATAQINGITGQVKSYKGVLDAVGSLEAESKKTPPDPTALKGYAVALSKVDLKGLPANDPVRAQVIGDLAGYNKLANTNLKPTDTSAVPAAHPAGQPSTWTVGKTGQQTSIWDIAQHVLTKSRPAGSPAPSDQDVFEYAQHIINNKNNPALLRGNGDVSGNVILNGQKLDLPAPPPPPVADPGTSTNQDPTRPSSTVTA